MTSTDSECSDAKRAFVEKYLHGDIPRATKETGAVGRALLMAPTAPIAVKYRAPTIAIQASGSSVPFFFPHVHWQGGASYCFTLAHDLGPDQPFYVVEPYAFDDRQVPPTLEEIAAECVKSVRAIQPEGPYHLGGYCGAGFIVYEMAQQLNAAGQRVEKLVMIEPGVGPYYAPLLSWTGKLVRRAGTVLRRSPDQQLSWFLRMRHLYRMARYPAYRRAQKFSLASTPESLREDWLGIFVWIVSTYVAQPYHGKATYIWARDDSGSHRNWWLQRFMAQETEMHYTSGDRSNCRNTYIHDLAANLRICLSSP